MPATSIKLQPLQNPRQLRETLHSARNALAAGELIIDGSELASLCPEWVAFLNVLQREVNASKGKTLRLRNFSPEWKQRLNEQILDTTPAPDQKTKGLLETWGDHGYTLFHDLKHIAYLFSESIYWSTLGRFEKEGGQGNHGLGLQLLRLGGDALPVVTLLSFLIGLTLAFQSAVQLEPLGASVYLVQGVGISMFSEVAPLMTAIILAGRSGASITAEISSMVVQEEVKALRTMGIHPVRFLVVPRFQAMSIAVPILTYLSALAGIFAGLIIALSYAKLPFSLFLSELQSGVPLSLLWQCGVKGLTFGWIITLVAAQKGLSVKGGADAVGRATTSCVVFSIAAIILTDAIFSFLFYW